MGKKQPYNIDGTGGNLMKNYSAQLAKMFKERDNVEPFQSCIGEVIKAPPELTIKVMNGNVILYPKMLYMNDRLFDDYTRTYKLTGDIKKIKLDRCKIETTSSNSETGPGPHKHDHGIIEGELNGNGSYETEGSIINTCTLVIGDLVKLTPVESGQMWFVDYKVRKISEVLK